MLIEFCIPAHNEEKLLQDNILKLWQYLCQQNFPFDWQIVIIINGSSDRSLNIAVALAKDYSQLKVVNILLPGKGRALKQYFTESKADILVYMDADLAVALDNVLDLIKPIIDDDYDLAIGSRLLSESTIERSLFREFISQSYNLLSRLILRHRFSDLQCGFKAFKKSIFIKLEPYLKDDYWFFDTELVIWSQRFNCRVKEVPVDWEENRYDQRVSKVNVFRDSWRFFKNLLKIRYRLWKLHF